MSKRNNLQSGITQPKPKEISAHIDWISITVPFSRAMDLNHCVLLMDDYQNAFQNVRGSMGYMSARKYQSGAVAQWNNGQPSMGYHVTYSAQALLFAANNFNLTQEQILENLTSFGRVSRIDMALDVSGVPIDIRQLHQDAVKGVLRTRAKTFDYVESAKSGQEIGARTTYIGSMHKRKKLLRIYDKGMQLNLDDFKTRFELEVHGVPAQHAGRELKSSSDMAQSIRSMISGYADFSSTHAGQFLSSDTPIKLVHPKYQKSDTAAWLIDVVAKTLAKEAYADYNVMEHFLAAFNHHYSQISGKEDFNES